MINFKDYDLTTIEGRFNLARAINKLAIKNPQEADKFRPLLSEAMDMYSDPEYTIFKRGEQSYYVVHHNLDWLYGSDEFIDFCRKNKSNYCGAVSCGYTHINGLDIKGEPEQVHSSTTEHWWLYVDSNNKLWFMKC